MVCTAYRTKMHLCRIEECITSSEIFASTVCLFFKIQSNLLIRCRHPPCTQGKQFSGHRIPWYTRHRGIGELSLLVAKASAPRNHPCLLHHFISLLMFGLCWTTARLPVSLAYPDCPVSHLLVW